MEMKKESREKLKSTAQKTIERRKDKQNEAIPYFKEWGKKSPKGVCVVCGEFMKNCLDKHHPEGRKNNWTIEICASCHRIFDKMGGVEELIERRKRYLNYNHKIINNLSKRKDVEEE
mgnify:CR=1 FL=1